MKRLAGLLIVLIAVGAANASLSLVLPGEVYDGQRVNLGIDAVGEQANIAGFITFEGPVSVDLDQTTFVDIPGISNPPYITNVREGDIIFWPIPDPFDKYSVILCFEVLHIGPTILNIPDGRMIDGISMTAQEPGQVKITLLDATVFEIFDSAEIRVVNPEPRIIYVDGDAPGANDGSSWANAYNYLQDALADAESGQKPVEIRVAQGVYKPDRTTVKPNGTGDESKSFELFSGLSLCGGYAGFGQSDPNFRDIAKYETILSGDLTDNDVEIEINDPCDMFNEPTTWENSLHVVVANQCDNTSRLDGFTIMKGTYYVMSELLHFGGGGMRIISSSPVVVNCSFVDNAALEWGGGVGINGNGNPTFINCLFKGNCASYGGGIGSHTNTASGSVTLINCAFIGNLSYGGGGIGIYARGGESDIILTNCVFADNYAPYCRAIGTSIGFATITNSILWDGGDEIGVGDDSMISVKYCNVHGGWQGEGNINADPFFVDPDNGDYHLKSQAGRWDPNSNSWVQDDVTSPCIDAGDPASPIGPEPFPNGGIINMGAYGGTPEASKSYFGKPVCETIVAGDINGDCLVDFADIALMLSHWLQAE